MITRPDPDSRCSERQRLTAESAGAIDEARLVRVDRH
jgi:hypothetical protein